MEFNAGQYILLLFKSYLSISSRQLRIRSYLSDNSYGKTMNYNKFWSPYCGAVSITLMTEPKINWRKLIPPMDRLTSKERFILHPHGDDWQKRFGSLEGSSKARP